MDSLCKKFKVPNDIRIMIEEINHKKNTKDLINEFNNIYPTYWRERFRNYEIIDEISLPIGPLRFLNEKLELSWGDKTTIKNYINSVPWLKCGKGHPFYMVGGTWRLLSKLHLKNNNWPVPILHNYQIPRDEIQNFTNTISKKSVEALNEDFSINFKNGLCV